MGKNWVFIVAALGGVIVIAAVILFNRFGSDDLIDEAAYASGLEMVVADTNRRAPIKLDEATYVVGAEIDGLHVTYRNELKWTLKPEDIEHFRKKQGTVLVQAVCADTETKQLLEVGAAFTYVYVDEAGTPAGEFTVSRKDC